MDKKHKTTEIEEIESSSKRYKTLHENEKENVVLEHDITLLDSPNPIEYFDEFDTYCNDNNSASNKIQLSEKMDKDLINNNSGARQGRPIRNTNLLIRNSPIPTTSIVTGITNANNNNERSPLTIVTTNNINNNAAKLKLISEPMSFKDLDIINNDNFFAYKNLSICDNEESENYFSRLSDEIVLSIFQWLPKKVLLRCGKVCHRFNNIAQDETLWVRLDMGKKVISSGGLGKIIGRGVVILRLAQSSIADNIFDIQPSSDYVCKLQYLDLSLCEISESGLKELLSTCKLLKKLSLERVPLNAAICCEIVKNKQLEALNLTMCEGINNVFCIKKLITELKLLQSLNISWTSLDSDCVKMFVDNAPSKLARLNIAGCRQSMTDAYVTTLVKRCPELRELDLSDCSRISSDILKIISDLKKLEYLSLSRCYNIPVATFLKINETISLEYLDIFCVLSGQTIKMLQEKFPSVGINKFIHSSVARPTVGNRRTSIWGLRTRD